MAKIIWSDEALADLEGVFQYLSLGSLVYAERYVAAAYDRVQILSQHPKIGKAVDEWQDQNFREIQYFPYRVIYEIRGEAVILHAFIHSRRAIPETPP